ncbi:MAG: translation initiation factor IF-2 N-terminal domain-containing protein, partial [Bacteroidota bacterium]
MSEERAIRINKVLRELNISLDRAVEFLKDKGHVIEASPNAKISNEEFNALYNQFSADKGNKAASLKVSEEKNKEKEALRVEREKELEEKRKQEEERQRNEVIKARATISGPVSVGKIDLNAPKKPEPAQAPAASSDVPATPVAVEPEPKAEKPVAPKAEEIKETKEAPKVAEEPKAQPQPQQPQVQPQAEKPKAGPAIQPRQPQAETPAAPVAPAQPEEEKIQTQYTKLTGATFTGQTIDLSQFNKPKKKKEDFRKDGPKPGTPGANAAAGAAAGANADKKKRNRILPNTNKPGTPGAPGQGNNRPGGPGNNRPGGNNQASPGKFGPNKRPAIVSKVEPTEEEVKNQIRETLEKLQGKGSKSKAAKYRRDKRDTHRQRTDDEQRMAEEGSKTIKVTEFVTVGEIATMMDVPITKVIMTCMSLGIMVTMNQRLDAETLTIVADEFGFDVEFITTDIEEAKEV